MEAKSDHLPVTKRRPTLPEADAMSLILQCEQELQSYEADTVVSKARGLALGAGLAATSDLRVRRNGNQAAIAAALTGGHSNTDHAVVCTGDYVTDRLAELRRQLLTRVRAEQPENKGEERWDKPRVPGERRRRIARAKDRPEAPPEAPLMGYVIFLSQMTTKIRHDRPREQHSQAKVMQEISKIWKSRLTDAERDYYNAFADEAKKEYKEQNMEFRATGVFTPSAQFVRVEGTGLWLKKKKEEKNDLEKEIDTYESVIFPPRPPEFDEDYRRRDLESKLRRKMKMKGLHVGEGEPSTKKRNVKVTTMASV